MVFISKTSHEYTYIMHDVFYLNHMRETDDL